jgi:hypothetical protein
VAPVVDNRDAVRAATEIATLDTVGDQLSLFGAKWLERRNSGIRDTPRLVSSCLSGRSAWEERSAPMTLVHQHAMSEMTSSEDDHVIRYQLEAA